MKRTYDTGIDTNQITFGVIVGTVGTAYTSVYLNRSGGQNTKIKESDINSANIQDSIIGDAKTLKNAYLLSRTTIDFSNINPTLWPNQVNIVVIRYHLAGGFSGDQVYNQDIDDMDVVLNGQILVITKPIKLL